MELEESTCLTSGSTTKPQSSRQYGTGTKTEIQINGTKGLKAISLTSGAGKTGQPTTCKRMRLEHFLTPYTQKDTKWIKDLNVRSETIKLLEENIGKTLSDTNHSRILYDPPPRILEIKTKINKWDLIKLKTFCRTKETTSKVKRQP